MADIAQMEGRERREPGSRKIVLVDLENMLFGRHTGAEPNQSDRSSEILALAQARRPGDMIIVGCNPHLAFLANDLFAGAQIVTERAKMELTTRSSKRSTRNTSPAVIASSSSCRVITPFARSPIRYAEPDCPSE